MCDLNCCRERFCGVSLRNANLIFGFLDVIFCISIFLLLFSSNTIPALIASASIVVIYAIVLFFGVYQERNKILRIFVVLTAILAGCAASLFVYCVYTLASMKAENQSEASFISVLSVLALRIFTVLVGLMILLFIVHIFVIRSYQNQLKNDNENHITDIPAEEESVP